MREIPHDPDARREHLINLNKLEIVLACAVALLSLVSAFGSWYVLPYRVSQVEVEQKSSQSKAEIVQREMQAKIDEVRRTTDSQKELLIRIDERLRQVQIALKIPTAAP